MTVVAAAANDGASASHRVPAAYNEVITVSALADMDGKPGGLGGKRCYSWGGYDKDDTFADFSNYGHDVDLIAPGKCIWSTKPGPTYGYSSGTSMAAPAVTGAVALYKASRPLATPAQVKEALQYLGTLSWKTSTDPDSTHEKLLDVSRLGPLGTFGIVATQPAAVGEAGGAVAVPLTLGRSATFFERVSLGIGSLPDRLDRCARQDEPDRLDRDGDNAPARAPEPDPGGHVSRHGERHEPGARADHDRERRRRERPADSPGRGHRDRGQGQDRDREAPAVVSWSAATDKTSAISAYEIQFRKNGGAWYGVKTASSTVRSFRRSLAFNATYEARLRARDGAGNWSPWVATAPFRAALVDDRSGSVKYTASWVKTRSSAAISDTLHSSTKLHARIGYTFTGRSISAVAPLGPGRAKVRVSIDGVYQGTVDLRRAGTHHRRVFFTKTFASSGTHKITLEIVSGGRVQLDAFIVLK